MNIKAISFDLGGTLVYVPEKSLVENLIQILNMEDEQRVIDMVKTCFMIDKKDISLAVGEFCNRLNHLELYESVFNLAATYDPPVSLYSETLSVLENLILNGYKLVLISNNYFWNQNSLLEENLRKYFEHELFSNHCNLIKPNKEIFEKMERMVGVQGNEIIHVGDSLESDYFGALNAGWNSLLLDREGRIPRIKNKVSKLDEIIHFLKGDITDGA